MAQDIPVQEISELLEAVSSKVPNLISSLLRTIYSEEAGKEMGKAVGSLYKELVAADIPKDVALKMAMDYMISLKDMVRQATNIQGNGQYTNSEGHGGNWNWHSNKADENE